MSTWKSARHESATSTERRAAPLGNDEQQAPPKAVKITALELEVDPEIGCDPYNSTGQHLVDAIRGLQKD